VSYFIFVRKFQIDQIEELVFQPTYSFGGSRSLWIVGHDKNRPLSIQMTDMAYGRRPLIEVVKIYERGIIE
jgi:hypothetical protein